MIITLNINNVVNVIIMYIIFLIHIFYYLCLYYNGINTRINDKSIINTSRIMFY